MEMVKCKKCGTQYSNTISTACPNCGSPETKKNSTALTIVLVAVGLIAIIVLGNVLSVGEVKDGETDSSDLVSNSDIGTTNSLEEDKNRLIYSDSNIKVIFTGLTDGSELGMAANIKACYINLKVENISNKNFTVTLTDAYVNNSAITIMSGVPMTLAPGKKSKAPFAFGYNNIVDSVEDIEKLEFKIMLFDQKSNDTLKTSETIEIEF